MEQSTQSMFCPSANLISPPVKATRDSNDQSAVVIPGQQPGNGHANHETIILEKDAETGSTYLHLVMPATALNFLNGVDGSSIFDFVKQSQQVPPFANG